MGELLFTGWDLFFYTCAMFAFYVGFMLAGGDA